MIQPKKLTENMNPSKLREIRRKSGLNQKGFAAIIGVTQNYVSEIENGKKQPSVRLLHIISQKFNCSMEWLLQSDDHQGDSSSFMSGNFPESNLVVSESQMELLKSMRHSLEKLVEKSATFESRYHNLKNVLVEIIRRLAGFDCKSLEALDR